MSRGLSASPCRFLQKGIWWVQFLCWSQGHLSSGPDNGLESLGSSVHPWSNKPGHPSQDEGGTFFLECTLTHNETCLLQTCGGGCIFLPQVIIMDKAIHGWGSHATDLWGLTLKVKEIEECLTIHGLHLLSSNLVRQDLLVFCSLVDFRALLHEYHKFFLFCWIKTAWNSCLWLLNFLFLLLVGL